jgi:hypothetical protein
MLLTFIQCNEAGLVANEEKLSVGRQLNPSAAATNQNCIDQ